MIIDYKTAQEKGLIQITDWARKDDPTRMLSDEYQVIAVCPHCQTPLKTKKRLDLKAYEWMNIYTDRMNTDCKERNFVVVQHRKFPDQFAVFAKPPVED